MPRNYRRSTGIAVGPDMPGGDPLRIQLWTPTTLALTRTISSVFRKVSFSPDGTAIATLGSGTNITRNGSSISISIGSSDRQIRMWNANTGATMTAPNVGTDALGSMAFSTDWSVLITADGSSGRIRIFTR